MRHFLVCFLLIIGVAPRANAFQRVYQSMGHYLRASPLVIVADIETAGEPRIQTTLTAREILKDADNSVAVGDKIELPQGITRYVVPREARNALVVMAPDWKKHAKEATMMVSEVYQMPAQIEAARALLGIYNLPGERAQLLALQKLVGQGNANFDEQWLDDLRRMRNRDNFELALASYARLQAENQAKLLNWLGDVGDERALPLFIGALDSPDKRVRGTAANALEFRFPDAPGVTAAFEKLQLDDARRPLAAHYLRMRSPATDAATSAPTAWLRAQATLKNGDNNGARAAFFALVEADDNSWTTLNSAEKLVPLLQTDADKTRLRALIGAQLTRATPDYLQARQFVKVLRALPDATNVAPLLTLLAPPAAGSTSLWDETAGAATFALLELGAEARGRGAAQVVALAKKRLVQGQIFDSREATFYACELAWLADDATWRDLPAQLAPAANEAFAALQPLRRAAQSPAQARDLAALMPGFLGSWQGNGRGWILARLGDLRDPVAVAPLFAQLKLYPQSGINNLIQSALIQIGGPEVEAGALELLKQEQPELRGRALEMLHAIRGMAVRPLLLQVMQNGDASDRIKAVTLLGYVGLPADLPLLLPLADFWQTEGTLQNRAASAVTEIRYRDLEARNGKDLD